MGKKEYNYEYEGDTLIRATECDITLNGEVVTSKVVVNTVKYYYDNEGKETKKVITPASGSAQTIYFESNDDNTVVKFTAGGRTVTSHSKSDSFGRKIFDELQLGTDFVSRQFVYHAGKITAEHKSKSKVKSSATTQLVSQITLSNGTTLSYGYDAEERITSVVESYTVDDTPVTNTTTYTYDALGQLLTETVNGTIVNSMVYDNYGNIVSKNNVPYEYDAVWKDLLTSYNGQSITYDAQGNPTSYLGHTLTWEKGRQLKKFDNIEYTYNANGIRTSKKVNGVLHTYTLDGTKILRETWGNNTLIPLYDNEDSVCGIIYNGTPYYFIKNLQGDVIAIVDKDAATVAKYSYDAWGVCSVIQDSSDCDIATVNPYRYRGYYFDQEIGMYYLQSRYYNPVVARFVNGDRPDFPVTFNVLESNLYAYAINNPVNNIDVLGNIAAFLAKKIGSVLINAAIGLLAQILGDVIMGAIKRKLHYSSLGTYIAAILKGAWDGLWGGGVAKEICKSLLSNILSQIIDKICGRRENISLVSLLTSVIDGILTYVIGKVIKIPKYIRDIKKKASSKLIKGTKKLLEYLNKQIWKKLSITLTLSGISNFITQLVDGFFNYVRNFLYQLYDELKMDLGGMKVA